LNRPLLAGFDRPLTPIHESQLWQLSEDLSSYWAKCAEIINLSPRMWLKTPAKLPVLKTTGDSKKTRTEKAAC
jgi:hypothetical protein